MTRDDFDTANNETLDEIVCRQDANGGIFADQDLAAMNAKYAVVKIGGKTRVVSLEASPAYPGSLVPVFSTIPISVLSTPRERKKSLDPMVP
jgi:hypothetical protein